jgi:NitT/TauT family transport system substrate-binding protein
MRFVLASGGLQRRSRIAGATGIVAGLLLVAGCHVPGTSSSAAAPSVSGTVTVAATPGMEDAPLFIGLQDGLFRAAGLSIVVHTYPTVRASLAALRKGTDDIQFGSYVNMFYAQERKPSPHLTVVADGYDCAPDAIAILTLPGSKISSPAALAGKTIGTALPDLGMLPAAGGNGSPLPFSPETTAAWAALQSNNVNPQAVHWQPMSPDALVNTLHLGGVDAIAVSEPTIYQAEQQYGAIPVLDGCSGGNAGLPLDGYFSTHRYAQAHGADLAAFRSALAKAQAVAGTSLPVQTVLEQVAQFDAQTSAMVTTGAYPTALEPSNLQRVADQMFRFGSLASPLQVSKMLGAGRG